MKTKFLVWSFCLCCSFCFANSIKDLAAKAVAGDKDAQYEIGLAFYEGKTTKQNYEKAIEWLDKAAEQGHSEAMYLMAICFAEGRGAEKDLDAAKEMMLKAADAGSKNALNVRWRYMKKGSLGYESAVRYAADNGAMYAQREMALHCNGGAEYWKKLALNTNPIDFSKDDIDKIEFNRSTAMRVLSDIYKEQGCTEKYVYWCMERIKVNHRHTSDQAKKHIALLRKNFKTRKIIEKIENGYNPESGEAISKKGKANKRAEVILAKSVEVAKSVFVIHGFYLGMDVEDALTLAQYYLPNSNVKQVSDGIEIDAIHNKEIDEQPMYFCQVSGGKVIRFNFDKKFLCQWFKYDAQNCEEWIETFSKEHNMRFVQKDVSGKRDLGNAGLSVSQECWRHISNRFGCEIRYFGEKDVLDPNGELNAQDVLTNPELAGKVAGLRAWVKNGWENGDGAREGTLRIEKLRE